MQTRYDAIVVGAGSAGCIVARRLSDAGHKVLLVEAGADPGPIETPDIRHPYPLSAYDTSLQWPGLKGQIVAGDAPRSARIPQGRVVGGSSSINAMIALRGVAADFDEWRDAGAEGWGWQDVEPHFRRLESADRTSRCDDTAAIAITRQPPSARRPLSNALLRTWREAGFTAVEDPNSDFRDGYFVQPVSTDAGGRCSANRAYLGKTTRARNNLTLLTNTACLRLQIESGRVHGVEIETNGTHRQVRADQVFLCAGALQTPAILMRSGVGPAASLERLRIRVAADLPGVGQNLQNHFAIPLGVVLRGRNTLPTDRPTAHAALRLSSGHHPSGGDIYLSAWDRAAWHAAGGHIATLNVVLHRPLSRGCVNLRSADGRLPPTVDFNMLDHACDSRRMSEAVGIALGFLQSAAVREISQATGLIQMGPSAAWMGSRTPATRLVSGALGLLASLSPGLLRPLYALAVKPLPRAFLARDDHARTTAAMRAAIVLQYHQVGTCAMGPASSLSAVTSPQGSVHGIRGLSVADASILPAVPRANTNLPVMMAAEKISAMFLGR